MREGLTIPAGPWKRPENRPLFGSRTTQTQRLLPPRTFLFFLPSPPPPRFIFTAMLFRASRQALSTCARLRAVISLCSDASDAYLSFRAHSCRFSRSLLLTEALCVFVAVCLPTCTSVCGNSTSVVFLHRRCCLQFACPFTPIVAP